VRDDDDVVEDAHAEAAAEAAEAAATARKWRRDTASGTNGDIRRERWRRVPAE
jgi:hypothetical protein